MFNNRIVWCLEYLINEADDKFRIDVLDYIYGQYALKKLNLVNQ